MSTSSEALPAPDGPKPRLLIVDDVFDNRAVLGRRFERRGYAVFEADSGMRALEMIAAEGFDVVLLDVMMPDLDGRDVLRRIRETHSAVSLPVIMVTARTQSEDVVEALSLGANDYITKPVDFGVALARVQTQVGRKQAEEQVWRANEALHRANEDLERRVAERTAELVEANGRLTAAMERAEAANHSKDEFLANMSHELRTPLNGVIGMAQVLTSTPLSPQQAEMVGVINSSAEGLQVVLSELLDFVDLTSGRVELVRQVVPLGGLIRDAAAPCVEKARKKGLTFHIDVSPDAEGGAQVDPARLRQVLANLLDNAVKFTAQGGIILAARRQAPGAADVVIEVSDTGVGFEPAVADRLFERFEQADGSATRRFGGVGLGLAICRQLVEQMEGAISAEGRPGEGATFRVVVALPSQEGAAAPEPRPARETGRPLHVLCVEDHPVNRKVMGYMMEAAGLNMTAVENGAEAVAAFKAQTFDIVLMDIEMPVMDGLTATREIRAFEAAETREATPVIIVTAHGLPEHVRSSEAAGADRHVTKPVDPRALLGLIDELVNGGTESSPVQGALSA